MGEMRAKQMMDQRVFGATPEKVVNDKPCLLSNLEVPAAPKIANGYNIYKN